MNLDDLDIEIEDEDGTGLRNGTIRYKEGMVQFCVVDNADVVYVGRRPFWMIEHQESVEAEILKMV